MAPQSLPNTFRGSLCYTSLSDKLHCAVLCQSQFSRRRCCWPAVSPATHSRVELPPLTALQQHATALVRADHIFSLSRR